MCDEQNGRTCLRLEGLHQRENFRLHRDIDRRGRFVSNQEPWFAGEGHGNHHPLLHPTG
jgi:hypothetical protein